MGAIIVENLSKRFRRYHADRPRTFMEAALAGWRRLKPVDWFWVLKDIDFRIEKGQMLGVLGRNGAGKSTLLQLIGGIGRPDGGRVITQGRIGALFDLGSGFHTDLTGLENIWVSATCLGMTRREIRRSLDMIVEFAELANFIDNPLRTYSTGMQMRLAFSVAIHTSPDILLVDERLAVGDLTFQAKCLERIVQLKSEGCSIMLVSQTTNPIQAYCDQALWLDRGEMVDMGDPYIISRRYVNQTQVVSQRVKILSVTCLDPQEQVINSLKVGGPLTIAVQYTQLEAIVEYTVFVSLTDKKGVKCFSSETTISRSVLGKGRVLLHLERLDLSSGQYHVNVSIHSVDWQETCDSVYHQVQLEIFGFSEPGSILAPPRTWEICGSGTYSISEI